MNRKSKGAGEGENAVGEDSHLLVSGSRVELYGTFAHQLARLRVRSRLFSQLAPEDAWRHMHGIWGLA